MTCFWRSTDDGDTGSDGSRDDESDNEDSPPSVLDPDNIDDDSRPRPSR